MESDQGCHLILDPESAGTDLCGLLGRGGAWTLSVVLNNTTSPTDSPVESFPATLALHSPIHIAHTYFLVTTSHLCTGHPTPGQRRERTPIAWLLKSQFWKGKAETTNHSLVHTRQPPHRLLSHCWCYVGEEMEKPRSSDPPTRSLPHFTLCYSTQLLP